MKIFKDQSGQAELSIALILVIVVLAVVGIVALFSFQRIEIGHVGLVISYESGAKNIEDSRIDTLAPGQWFWIMPWDFKKKVDYSIAQQTMTMVRRSKEGKVEGDDSVECQLQGGAKINVDSSTIWRVNPNYVAKLYFLRPGLPLVSNDPKDQNDIGDQIVRREVRNAITLACANYDFNSVFGPERIKLGQKAAEYLKPELEASFLMMDSFILGEIYPQKEQQDAMNAVLDAQLKAKAASYAKEKAENEAAGVVAQAEGEKKARILHAEAESEYIRITTERLNASPKYIEYQYSQKWNGVMPSTLVMSDGQSFPLMGALNLSTMPVTATTPSLATTPAQPPRTK